MKIKQRRKVGLYKCKCIYCETNYHLGRRICNECMEAIENDLNSFSKNKYNNMLESISKHNYLVIPFVKKTQFEDSLKKNNIEYFVYIKCIINKHNNIVPANIGISASMLINEQSDVSFNLNDKGHSKTFIKNNDAKWSRNVYIIPVENKYTGEALEKYLQKELMCWGQ